MNSTCRLGASGRGFAWWCEGVVRDGERVFSSGERVFSDCMRVFCGGEGVYRWCECVQ